MQSKIKKNSAMRMKSAELKPRHVVANGTFVFLFVTSIAVLAQTQNATIKGVITDSTNLRIPQSVVTATNQRTQVSRAVETNEAGDYVITNLQPGIYRVEVSKEGFQRGLLDAVTLNVNQTLTLDIQLQLGAVTRGGQRSCRGCSSRIGHSSAWHSDYGREDS